MSITDKEQRDKSFYNFGAGNIVPTWWYSAIKAGGDKPDLVAITILSELWFLYRKRGIEEYNEGYDYFERKFNFSKSQLQDATRRLHDNGIIERSFRSIKINRGLYPNVLHITLNISKLLLLRKQYDNNFFDSDSDDAEVSSDVVLGNSQQLCWENSDEYIKNERVFIKKNKLSKSIFCEFFNVKAIDAAWLSKLDHKIDQQNKIIYFISVKSLVVKWVSERYLHFIESVSRALNFQVELVITK